MIFIVFRLMILLSSIFIFPLALIHTQPYNAIGLTSLLTPPASCPVPCFLGIRPGETTINTAGRLLDANPTVRFFVFSDEFNVHNTRQRIDWEYHQPHRVIHGSMYVEDSIIRRVTIYDIPLAEVWLSMGQPDLSYEVGEINVDSLGQTSTSPVMLVGYYAHWDVQVNAAAVCASFWQEDAPIYVFPDGHSVEAGASLQETPITTIRQRSCRALRDHPRALRAGGFLTRLPQTYQMIASSS